MPHNIILPFPTRFALDSVLESEPFLKDAVNFASIPDQQFKAAIEALQDSSEFLGRERVLALIKSHVTDSSQATSFASFVINFNQLRRDLDEAPEDFERAVIEKLPATLATPEREVVIARLVDVVRPKSGLERQAKAEEVIRKTNAHIHDLMLICDLRPVFNDAGDQIDGMVPVTTLRMILHKFDRLESVEVRLNEQQVNSLCKEATRAKLKLATLKQFVRSSSVPLPDTSATVEDDDS